MTNVNGFQTHFIGLGVSLGLGRGQCEHILSHTVLPLNTVPFNTEDPKFNHPIYTFVFDV